MHSSHHSRELSQNSYVLVFSAVFRACLLLCYVKKTKNILVYFEALHSHGQHKVLAFVLQSKNTFTEGSMKELL